MISSSSQLILLIIILHCLAAAADNRAELSFAEVPKLTLSKPIRDGPCKGHPRSQLEENASTWKKLYFSMASGIEGRIEFRRTRGKTHVMRKIVDLCQVLEELAKMRPELLEIAETEVKKAREEIESKNLVKEFLDLMEKSCDEGKKPKFKGTPFEGMHKEMKKKLETISDKLNKKWEQSTMPAKRSMDNGQKAPFDTSQQKAREQQWLKPKNPNVQQEQQMHEQRTSSVAIEDETEENSSIDSEEEEKWYTTDEDEGGNDENEPMRMEMKKEDVEELEMLPVANFDGKAEKKKLKQLIHTRQLLEAVLCPWEKIQEFIWMRPNDYWKVLTPTNCHFIKEILVAFHVLGNDEMVYIDQISEFRRGTILFEHYGAIEIDTIQPHYGYGRIGDEDFEQWLDTVISSGEELPRGVAKFQARKHFLNFLGDLISTSIFGRLQQNPKMLFDGMVEQFDKQILQPLGFDISSIILHPDHFHVLLKICQPEFAELLTGLYLEVKVSEIAHSMKLPPLMTSLNHMLIPISMVTFDALRRYKVPLMPKQMTCDVMVHVKNAKGDVICSAILPREMKFPNEELVPVSVAIWRMNNIALPTFDHVHQKSEQLERAFVSAKEIKFAREIGNLPFPRYRVEWKQMKGMNKEERWTFRQANRERQKADALTMAATIGIVDNGNVQEIWQKNFLHLNCQMPPNFAKIVLKPAQIWDLHSKLTTEQLKALAIGMFVHVKIPPSFKLFSLIDFRGHLILPIAALDCKKNRGKENIYIHFPECIKLCNEMGFLRKKVSVNCIEDSCEEYLIEECAMILNACKIAPLTEEFIAKKEWELRRWLC